MPENTLHMREPVRIEDRSIRSSMTKRIGCGEQSDCVTQFHRVPFFFESTRLPRNFLSAKYACQRSSAKVFVYFGIEFERTSRGLCARAGAAHPATLSGSSP